MKVKSLSRVRLLATPWTATYQAPLSMGFPRQEYWSGLLFPSPRDLPNPVIKSESPVSHALQADSLPLSHMGSPSVYPSMLDQNGQVLVPPPPSATDVSCHQRGRTSRELVLSVEPVLKELTAGGSLLTVLSVVGGKSFLEGAPG